MSTGNKRKAPNQPLTTSSHARKRQKFQDARTISTQTADGALSKAGELNIASFIKSREFEIGALDNSIQKARQGLSNRAFQQVPRHMRRRTASHNAKKVPRRLRSRASREMIEDKTPTVNSKTRIPTSRLRLRLETAKALEKLTQQRRTIRQRKREAKLNAAVRDPAERTESVRIPKIKKNKLADPPLATSKFKRRQVNKTWLPTHMWHTKRAQMTRPTEPLWRMAIPLTPREKSYRGTHRASGSRGCVAWDMSYMSTVGCFGTDTSLEGLLKALGFHGHGWTGAQHSRWKIGSRFASGWICAHEGKQALGTIDVLWCASNDSSSKHPPESALANGDVEMTDPAVCSQRRKAKLDRRLMIRIHPSAFHQFWKELLQAAKSQKPQVLVEDLRFEIGSIELVGLGSMEALQGVLKPSHGDESFQRIWNALSVLSNPALLPNNTVLSFDVQDPRLQPLAKRTSAPRNDDHDASLHDLVADWPFDATMKPSSLFSYKARYTASKLPSKWTLDRRRKALLPGQALQKSTKDPSIPVILLAHRPSVSTTAQQGRWTLLAPWKCIDTIWRRLLYYPLSSGNNPCFGSLYQKQQVAFEQRVPWYPGDYPGTEAGQAWERSRSEKRFDEWIRRPPSRRVAWERLDLGLDRRGELGNGWACDWQFLLQDALDKDSRRKPASKISLEKAVGVTSQSQPPLTQRQRIAARAKAEMEVKTQAGRHNSSSPNPVEADEPELLQEAKFEQLTPSAAKSMLLHVSVPELRPLPGLATIRLKLIGKGTPNSAARIYRLPSAESTHPRRKSGTDVTKTTLQDPSAGNHALPSTLSPPSLKPMKQLGPASAGGIRDLRSRWLSLHSPADSCHPLNKITKEKPNHWSLPRKAYKYEPDSLRDINVLPKNAPPQIYEQYGPKPLSEEEKRLVAHKELAVRLEEQKVWDTHIPCPGAGDLIGFVTSGGYNLAEGRGTAIGGVWLQKVIQSWVAEENAQSSTLATSSVLQTDQKSKPQRKANRRKDWERHLCIVRNAGESIGRLALWELCE